MTSPRRLNFYGYFSRSRKRARLQQEAAQAVLVGKADVFADQYGKLGRKVLRDLGGRAK